ncbi:MORC3 [Branchiostoma lanceolatum]|uniref:MORC3 protein n=1 Tax=Branchiostoma lanceolatum TaxID=7740 RepID=A0A8J9YJE4_BRALA|nr:MORC3 [Branchiostoma lanceolatum]
MMQSAISTEHGIRQSKTSPGFLHSNSTSHTWPFSAIAELIDNAYDPDVAARQLFIDMEKISETQCLTFTDNGAGMTPDKLHKMLSFGFCEKVEINGHKPVGNYGNGFKSGSMRLGKDAMVFTKNGKFMIAGLLSQTYLKSIQAETVIVPIVPFDTAEIMLKTVDSDPSLEAITKYSIFKSKQQLMEQFKMIPGRKGTRIVIYNIRRTRDGRPEFDFTDEKDIKIPDDVIDEQAGKFRRQDRRQDYSPECDYSLRAYCSILYLNPKMQIILRGQKVKTFKIAKSLNNTERDVYKPQWLPKGVKITFGFSPQKHHYGIMMYHRNRLIKGYERVGPQLKAGRQGVGVIGVIQCDFLKPTHNKQDFDYTKEYRSTVSALGLKLTDYWLQKKGHISLARSSSPAAANGSEEDEPAPSPDQLWVQCDNADCLKWRKLPEQWKNKKLPDKWYCNMNPDPKFRSCSVPEEAEDDPDEEIAGPSYDKSVRRQLEREKREEKWRKEQKQQQEIEERERQLRQKDLQLQRLGAQIQQSIQSQAAEKKPSQSDLVRAEIEMNRRKQMETQYNKMVVELKKQGSQLQKQREDLLQAQQVAHHWQQRAEAAATMTPTECRSPEQRSLLNQVRQAKAGDGQVQKQLIARQVKTPEGQVQKWVLVGQQQDSTPRPVSAAVGPGTATQTAGTPIEVVTITDSSAESESKSQNKSQTTAASQTRTPIVAAVAKSSSTPVIPNVAPTSTNRPAQTPDTTMMKVTMLQNDGKMLKITAVSNKDGEVMTITCPGGKMPALDKSKPMYLLVPKASDDALKNGMSNSIQSKIKIVGQHLASSQTAKVSGSKQAQTPVPRMTQLDSRLDGQPEQLKLSGTSEQVQSQVNLPECSTVANHNAPCVLEQVSTATASQRTPRQPQAGPSGVASQKRPASNSPSNSANKVPRMADDSDDDCIIIDDSDLTKTNSTSSVRVKTEICHIGVQTDPADVVRVSASTVREVATLSTVEQRQKLMEQTKQLKTLRRNVSRLIGVLVPELSLEDNDIDMESESVDELLKQVLEANKNQ